MDATRVLLGWHRGVPLPSARPGPPALAKNLTSPSHPGLVPAPGRLRVAEQCHLLAKPPPRHPAPRPPLPVPRPRLGTGKPRHGATEPRGAQRGLPPAPRPLSPACRRPRGPQLPSCPLRGTSPRRLGERERERKEQDPQHLRRLINKMEINPPAFAAKRCPRGVAFNNSNAAAERSPRQWVLINSAVM